MFRLQRLEITGFKSFADYTEVLFTGNGITAVVGPNGCGKSNVSDAISWVLGEQRPTSLRGQEMKDVVFQGTNKRSPGGMAEVVLHLVRDETEYPSDEADLEEIDERLGEIDDHSVDVGEAERLVAEEDEDDALLDSEIVEEAEAGQAKALAAGVGSVRTIESRHKTKRHWRPRNFALEFAPGEAVTVTRRLYLSGESEYLLNNKVCRLRDIHDLFSGTGLSGAHYAIIEQGRIGQILSSKPSSRRSLIEEAAGISKFRIRQRAAESRLSSAKLNLGRITDIASEIEKQTRSLRRQAAKTKRFKLLKDELRTLLKFTYAAEGELLLATVRELDEKLSGAVSGEKEAFLEVSANDEKAREATAEARMAEEAVTRIRSEHAANALERDRAIRDHEYRLHRIEELRERSGALETEIKATKERIAVLDKEIGRLGDEEEKEREQAEEMRSRLDDARAVYRTKLEALQEKEALLESERAEHLQHTSAFERLQEIIRQFDSNIEKLTERTEGLEREFERAEKTHRERQDESRRLVSELTEARTKLSSFDKEKQGILAEIKERKEVVAQRASELEEKNEEHSGVKHRLSTLEELDSRKEIYAPGVQRIFKEEKKIGVRFIGTLAESLNVDRKAEAAVENLFGASLQTILVESTADAKKTIDYLNRNGLGRVGVLVVGKVSVKEKGATNGTGSISSLLGASAAVAAALKKAFPREMSARVAATIDDVDVSADGLTVTYDGDIVAGGRLFVSGSVTSEEKNVSILGFRRELGELRQRFESIGKEIEQTEGRVNEARSDLARSEESLVDLQSLIVKVERELLSKEVHGESLEREIDRAERHKNVVAEEISQNRSEIKQYDRRKAEAAEGATLAEKALVLSREKMETISTGIAEARSVVEEENLKLNSRMTQAEVAAERERSAKGSLDRVVVERSELGSRLERQERELGETKAGIEELRESVAALEERIEKSKEDQKKEQDELEAAIGHLTLSRQKSDQMSEQLADLNKVAAEARDRRAGLEIRRTEAAASLRNIGEKCSEDLNLELRELVETAVTDDDFDLESSKKRARELRSKLENFGAINMLALEELAETEERLEFLSSQKTDVEDSIKAAEEALREIKRRSRQRFRDAFEAINKNFAEFFTELFGGGSGEMVLMESDDVLEAGVEIIAQPPGKRLQNMLLLSGGEKAMTAISLVLAIFKYRPSPFCLLDEVDAPLDDANVGRFVGKIEEMAENTQFIVITHNKRTMEAAKALYGVTMQEPGVSKIVSVRFE